jgi:tetratricopeptide (TPR) repeat protein
LGNLAKLRIQQKQYAESVDLLQKRYQLAAHAENLYELAEALEHAGRTEQATKAFADFENKSLAETNRADNSNHELIFYYADHANQPDKALGVAQREYARRHDVFTLDCYAWALYVNGRYTEARKQIESALAVGIRDARLFRHAGEITLRCGNGTAARAYLNQAMALQSVESVKAADALARLSHEPVN